MRPVTIAARLAPYLRYYYPRRPTDDHGAQLDVLVDVADDIARTGFNVPCWPRTAGCSSKRAAGEGMDSCCGDRPGYTFLPT